jgi:hypothetical protein
VSSDRLTRRFIGLRALRWLPVGLLLPFIVLLPQTRGLSLAEVGSVFAVHSGVSILLEVPSGAFADTLGRRRVMLTGAALLGLSLAGFAFARSPIAFAASAAILAAGRALISGSLEAWYVDELRLIDPLAPLSRGLSRGAAAEGLSMAIGSLIGGGLVAIYGGSSSTGALSVYSIAALAGAAASVVYFAAVAALVKETPGSREDTTGTIARRTREIFVTARREAVASVTVRIVFITAVAFGVSITAVELLWQPRLSSMLANPDASGFGFGALAAGSMAAVAAGAALSPLLGRRFGIGRGYVLAMLAGGAFTIALGAPDSPLAFAPVFLFSYFAFGMTEPIHFELLNEAVGSTARATLLSGEALATQLGALGANLCVGALAGSQGSAFTWLCAGVLVMAVAGAIAAPLGHQLKRARPMPGDAPLEVSEA